MWQPNRSQWIVIWLVFAFAAWRFFEAVHATAWGWTSNGSGSGDPIDIAYAVATSPVVILPREFAFAGSVALPFGALVVWWLEGRRPR
jgi:hypothetical protein